MHKTMTMTLQTILKDAVKGAISETIALELHEIVAKETRRALQAHEQELTTLVRAAVGAAIAEMLDGTGEK
jgi:hypothetical protein